MKRVVLLWVFCSLGLCDIRPISQWLMTPYYRIDFESVQQRTKPVVVGDILYYADIRGNVFAVHRTGGYILWQKKLAGGVDGALAYGRSKILVGDLQGNLYALNTRDGSEAWVFKAPVEWLSPPYVFRDKIFAATSNDELYGLSEKTGKELWHFAHRGDEKMTIRGTSGPYVYGENVYQGFSDGSVAALTSADGKVLWTKRLKTRDRFYDVDMTPYADDKGVLASTFDGKFYSLDRETGNTKWVFSVGTYTAPWVEENRVYIAGLDGTFYALDRDTSAVVWKTELKEGLILGPTKVAEHWVVTSAAGSLFLLNQKTGELVAKETFGTPLLAMSTGTPDNWIYCLTNYSNLVSFEVKNLPFVKGPETVTAPSAVVRQFVTPNPKSSGKGT